MRILVELPTWLGDAVMTTPAIDNLAEFFSDSEITLVGSAISIDALKDHPKISNSFVLERSYISLYKTIKNFGKFDFFFFFRGSLSSKVV